MRVGHRKGENSREGDGHESSYHIQWGVNMGMLYLEHALLNDQGHQENRRNANVTLWENSVNTPCRCPSTIPLADPEATTATH